MLKMTFEVLMSLIIFLVMIQVFLFFFRRTFIGMSLIVSLKIIKQICRCMYLSIKGVYVLINKKVDKMEKRQIRKTYTSTKRKKVVNFNDYKNKVK